MKFIPPPPASIQAARSTGSECVPWSPRRKLQRTLADSRGSIQAAGHPDYFRIADYTPGKLQAKYSADKHGLRSTARLHTRTSRFQTLRRLSVPIRLAVVQRYPVNDLLATLDIGVRPLKQQSCFDHAARLVPVATRRTEHVTGREAVCPNKGEVPADEEALVLKGWCQRNGPASAARAKQ